MNVHLTCDFNKPKRRLLTSKLKKKLYELSKRIYFDCDNNRDLEIFLL